MRVICSGTRVLAAELFMSQCLDQDLEILNLVASADRQGEQQWNVIVRGSRSCIYEHIAT